MTDDFDIKKVISWATRDKARKYIGEKCYLEDTIKELQSVVKDDFPETLARIDDDNRDAFINSVGQEFGFLYPKEKENANKTEEKEEESTDNNGLPIPANYGETCEHAKYRLLYQVFDLLIYGVDSAKFCRSYCDGEHQVDFVVDKSVLRDRDFTQHLTDDLKDFSRKVSYLLTRGEINTTIQLLAVELVDRTVSIRFKIDQLYRDKLVNYMTSATKAYVEKYFSSKENK